MAKHILPFIFLFFFSAGIFAIDDIVLYDENGSVFFTIKDNNMYAEEEEIFVGKINDNEIQTAQMPGCIKFSEEGESIQITSYGEKNDITGIGCFYKSTGMINRYTDHYGNTLYYEYGDSTGKLKKETLIDVINNIGEVFEFDEDTGKKISCTYVYNDSALTCPYIQFNDGNFYLDGSHLLKSDMCDYEALAFYDNNEFSDYILWNENYSASIRKYNFEEAGDDFAYIKYLVDNNIHIESNTDTVVFYTGADDMFYCFKLVDDMIEMESCYQIKLIENHIADYKGSVG